MISVHNLWKTYKLGKIEVNAVRNATFDVENGEFVIIFGNSGSGKSTLVHLIGLLDEPSKGNVVIDKTDMSGLNDKDKTKFRLKKMGFIFQEYNILPEMTVLENVMLPALMTSKSRHEIIKRAKQIIRYIGLGHRINHVPAELSGGEKQRVSIARSLINNPEIIIADEPTANLDSKNSDLTIGLFSRLNRQLKLTVFLVTHNPKYLPYATKVVHLEDGMIKNIEDKKKNPSISREMLHEYVKECVKRGIPHHKIREHLSKKGWPARLVDAVMSRYN